MMSEYGLTSLDTHDVESVRSIMSDLAGSGFLKFGALLSAKGEDNAKIAYLSAICEQNWIIIRQLDRISKALEK